MGGTDISKWKLLLPFVPEELAPELVKTTYKLRFNIKYDSRHLKEKELEGMDDMDNGRGLSKTSRKDQTYYDLVVKMNKLRELETSGWQIEVNNKSHSLCFDEKKHAFCIEKESKVTTVGIVGRYNGGKTFVLNNLCADPMKLPESVRVHTDGLSIKQVTKKNVKNQNKEETLDVVLIDTAGRDTPISISEDADTCDKMLMESILSNVVYEISCLHILVVNDLKWSNQKEIQTLASKISKQKNDDHGSMKSLPVIVVHNLPKWSLDDLKAFLFGDSNSAHGLKGTKRDTIETLYPKGKFAGNTGMDTPQAIKELFKDLITNIEKDANQFWNNLRGNIYKDQVSKEIKERVNKSGEPRYWFNSGDNSELMHLFLINNDTLEGKVFNYYVFRQIEQEIQRPSGRQYSFSFKKVFNALNGQVTKHAKLFDRTNQNKRNDNEWQVMGRDIDDNDEPSTDEELENAYGAHDPGAGGGDGDSVNTQAVTTQHLGFITRVDTDNIDDYRIVLHPELKDKKRLHLGPILEHATPYMIASSLTPNHIDPIFDIQFTGNECQIFVEIPGLDYKKCSIDWNPPESVLTISGKITKSKEYWQETSDDTYGRSFGSFKKVIQLPKDFQVESIGKSFNDGILRIKLQKLRPVQVEEIKEIN